jgi:cytochrome c6
VAANREPSAEDFVDLSKQERLIYPRLEWRSTMKKFNPYCFAKAVTVVIFLVTPLFLAPLLTGAQDTAAGGALYKTKCAACHGTSGKGDTAVGKADNIRDLASADVQKQSDADLTTIITSGKGKMPAYGKSLKPNQVKDLVAYIRSIAQK